MRYAFISDIHANLQAWRAVHIDIRSNHVDYILCLGDVIGYGPSPAAVLNEVHAHVDAFVLGNHDAAISGRMDDSSFNPHAREMIRWTAARLNRKASTFLSSFPLTLVGNGFRCAHGEFSRPANFDYVLNPEDALPSWQAVDAPLLLVGHTHEPAFYLIGPSGVPRQAEVQDFEIEPGKRYFVNVGSVGCPRDGDPRASYSIYDTQARAVFWRRVPFDLNSYRTTVIRAGLDPAQCHFLNDDPLAKVIPIRDLLDFTPPTTAEKTVQNAVAVQDVTTMRRSLRQWKMLFLLSLSIIVATLLISLRPRQEQGDNRTVIGCVPPPIDSTIRPTKSNLLVMPDKLVYHGDEIPGWQIQLDDSRHQATSVIALKNEGLCLQLESKNNDAGITLSSPVIQVSPGQGWSMGGLFNKSDPFAGSIVMAITLVRQGLKGYETNLNFYIKEPFLARADGWMKIRQAFRVPPGAKTIQLQIRGTFQGTVRARDLSLECTGVKPTP
ncbi:MAG: metallophosphoesterase family protein [bacterium]